MCNNNINVEKIAKEIEKKTTNIKKILRVAIMGCVVNPKEAEEADIGVVGGKDRTLLYKKGEIVGRIEKDRIISRILKEINFFVPSE